MVNGVVTIITTAFCVTALGIALRPNAPTAAVATALTNGIANMQKASFGPA